MTDKSFLVCTFILIFTNLFITIVGTTEVLKQKNINNELESQIKYVEYKMQVETEKYQRQVDTCLDIIVNKRWEQ